MAANATTLDDTLDDVEGLPEKRGSGRKKLMLFILLPLLLVGGGVGGLVATGIVDLGGRDGEHAAAGEPVEPRTPVFYDLPDLLVKLSPPETGRASWRESVCQDVKILVVGVALKKKTKRTHKTQ